MERVPLGKKILLGAISAAALGLIVFKIWPSDLVTKPDSLLKAAASNNPRRVFAVMGLNEREALGMTEEKFVAVYDQCFRPSLEGASLTGYKTSEINGDPPFSGFVARQVKFSNGSAGLLTANAYITENGAQVNVLRSLLYLSAACDTYKVKPAPSKVDKGKARLSLLRRLAESCTQVGVLGLYDEESREVIPWAQMEVKLSEHLAHFMKG